MDILWIVFCLIAILLKKQDSRISRVQESGTIFFFFWLESELHWGLGDKKQSGQGSQDISTELSGRKAEVRVIFGETRVRCRSMEQF